MKTRSWILLFVLLMALCAGVLLLRPRPQGQTTVCIYQDGQLLETIDLSQVEAPYTIPLTWKGSTNEITVSPGSIAVTWADCGCQTCVNHGPLQPGGMPIICLPNRLVIKWVQDPVVDAVA